MPLNLDRLVALKVCEEPYVVTFQMLEQDHPVPRVSLRVYCRDIHRVGFCYAGIDGVLYPIREKLQGPSWVLNLNWNPLSVVPSDVSHGLLRDASLFLFVSSKPADLEQWFIIIVFKASLFTPDIYRDLLI